jgi:23S rRNA pseudouridine2605 synthase
MDRLQKLIATAGYGSRRWAERLIEQGRIEVNNKTASIGDKAQITDTVKIDSLLAKLPLLVNNNKPDVFKSSRPTMTQRYSLVNKSKTLLRPSSSLLEQITGFAKFSRVSVGGGQGANRWYKVVLKEGRKREVRRLWESLGFKVSRLIRIQSVVALFILPQNL